MDHHTDRITHRVAPDIHINKQGNLTNFSIPSSSHPHPHPGTATEQPNINKRQASTPHHHQRHAAPRHMSNSEARRYYKNTTTSKYQAKPAASKPNSNGADTGLRAKFKQAINIVKENYAAGIEAAIAESQATRPRAKVPVHDQKHNVRSGRNEVKLSTTTRQNKITEPGQRMPRTQQPGSGMGSAPGQQQFISMGASGRLCSLCLRDGAILYAETGRALCELCRAKAFGPGGPSLPRREGKPKQTTIYKPEFKPSSVQPSNRKPAVDTRCTILPTLEQIASSSYGRPAERVPASKPAAPPVKKSPILASRTTILPPAQNFPLPTQRPQNPRANRPQQPQAHRVIPIRRTEAIPAAIPRRIPRQGRLYDPPQLDARIPARKPSSTISNPYRPILQIQTDTDPDPALIPTPLPFQAPAMHPLAKPQYAPAAWRTIARPAAHVAKAPSMKSQRATVASIWDDDEPDSYTAVPTREDESDVPPVPALPAVLAVPVRPTVAARPVVQAVPGVRTSSLPNALPQPGARQGARMPFASVESSTSASTSRGKPDAQVGTEGRQRVRIPYTQAVAELERQRYSPSIYSEREPSPRLDLGWHAVPEGQWEKL